MLPTKGDYVLLMLEDPIGCGNCPFNDPYNDCCKASKKSYGNKNNIKDRKPDFCPLKPIYTDETVAIPQGLVMYTMRDPIDCNNCMLNDFWGHCCRITGIQYTYEELHSGHRIDSCPMKNLYRNDYGSYDVGEKDS